MKPLFEIGDTLTHIASGRRVVVVAIFRRVKPSNAGFLYGVSPDVGASVMGWEEEFEVADTRISPPQPTGFSGVQVSET